MWSRVAEAMCEFLRTFKTDPQSVISRKTKAKASRQGSVRYGFLSFL